MALVYQCDRCGKFMDRSYESGFSNVTNNIFYISNSKQDGDQDYLDLCTDCYRSFAQWWNCSNSKYVAVYPFIKENNNEKSSN